MFPGNGAVHGNMIRKKYKDIPVILGGIEASLRRLSHYDYWSNSLKRSILLDAQADLVSYGMGEKSIVEIADALNSGIAVKDITFIPGTVYRTKDISGVIRGDGDSRDGIMKRLKMTRLFMPKASVSNIRTPMRLPQSPWRKSIPMVFMWCKIRP